MNFELCWNITARCNENCKYCHRFLSPKDLTRDENFKILNNIMTSGIKNVTFTGGEALLMPYLSELILFCSENDIKSKLITNGILFTDKFFNQIKNSLNYLNLSLDSISKGTNLLLGRGGEHFENVKKCLSLVANSQINLSINSVATKLNKNDLFELAKFLSDKNISEWRIFKFMPLREKAKVNEKEFEISQDEYEKLIKDLLNISNLNIVTRQVEDFEKQYLLILANGDIVVTKDGQDIVLGNALKDDLKFIINKTFDK